MIYRYLRAPYTHDNNNILYHTHLRGVSDPYYYA